MSRRTLIRVTLLEASESRQFYFTDDDDYDDVDGVDDVDDRFIVSMHSLRVVESFCNKPLYAKISYDHLYSSKW